MAYTVPQPRNLLPPLLACLPTAFVSPHPPPALLPLLSPILRQRVNLLSGNTSSGNGGWLSLLSWDQQRASKLGNKVEGLTFEPHPVSGELEIEDVKAIEYRRLDEETLQARLDVAEFELLPVYVWCENDEGGASAFNDGGKGWRLAELRLTEDRDDGTEWFESMEEAESAAGVSPTTASVSFAPTTTTTTAAVAAPAAPQTHTADTNDDDDDDTDYWAAYDRTPGRTPARTPVKRSPAPGPGPAAHSSVQLPSASELEYFARYAAEVQPALDAHDPDEEDASTADSTLRGGALTSGQRQRAQVPSAAQQQRSGYAHANANHTPPYTTADDCSAPLAPRATSPSSQASVDRLEAHASATETREEEEEEEEEEETHHEPSSAEIGVKQFMSTNLKSMFRLARSVGMSRGEFDRIVKTELDVLGLLEVDD